MGDRFLICTKHAHQIVALLFAGSETTANVLGEILHELAQKPWIQDRLRKELVAAAATVGRNQLTFDEIMSTELLPYLDAVLRESMRLKAVLMEVTRCVSSLASCIHASSLAAQAVEDDTIPLTFPLPDGTQYIRVRAGQEIMIPVREGLNINMEIWGPDSELFRPERWLDGAGPDHRDLIRAQYNMMTFGDG
jgi:cytochrome P450